MTQRVIITVKKGAHEQDLNVPVTASPQAIAVSLNWGKVNAAYIQTSKQTIGGDDPLVGKVRAGDLIIFDAEESSGWRK